jgi:hypothetical protein
MGARRSCGSSRRERLGAPLVRAESPAAGGGLVDRAAHEWVPKAEASRHVRCAKEIELQQLVHRLHHGSLRQLCCGRGQLELERIACHRRSFQGQTRRAGQQRELLGYSCDDRRRHTDRRQPCLVNGRLSTRAVERPRELLEEERVAAALSYRTVAAALSTASPSSCRASRD